MNTNRRMGWMWTVPAVMLLLGCADDSSTKKVTVSGTLTYANYVQGDYFVAVYPDGTETAETGFIAESFVAGTGMTADYEVEVKENEGDVYVFGFNDDDDSGGPSGANDGSACSAVFAVEDEDIGGIDITLDTLGFTNCPI